MIDVIFDVFTPLDLIALSWFLSVTITYSWYTESGPHSQKTLTAYMNYQRELWLRVLMTRDLRIVDTSIISGLQNGTAFFASASLLAIGGCFALLGATDEVAKVFSDLAFLQQVNSKSWELKVIGLLMIFAYAFFKFGWSFRLWNYASILIGAIPMPAEKDHDKAEAAMQRALKMNKVAAQHFNRGLRAFFYSIGFIGWFVGPAVFIIATSWITVILYLRQFRSASLEAASYGIDKIPESSMK